MDIKKRIEALEAQQRNTSQPIDGFIIMPYDLTPEEERAYLIEQGVDIEKTVLVYGVEGKGG
ncbi:MAG: hypothetical protein ACYC3O_03255 [Burkholderiales bacterium]